ncbi:MAG: D-arabinono-1,4-lactone oxidase [Parasphingorhabdus sp.]
MGLSRRTMLLGGAATAIALPAASHIYWSGKEYPRDDFSPGLPEATDGERPWTNWSEILKATPKEISFPTTTAEVAELVKTSSAPIRPVGSGHSFTALAPSEGTMIDVSAISGMIRHDTDQQTASFGAGSRLQESAKLLSEQGLGFANLPDIDVQTLAGGFATATHGTGYDLTAIHDYVQEFELVTPAGDIVTASVDNNSDLFQAGKVSLGSLGVITRFDLKVEKAFNLRRQTGLMKLENLLGQFDSLSQKYRNFEIYYFPHTGYGAYIQHDVWEGEVTGRQTGEDDNILADLKELRDTLGWWPWLRRKVVQGELEEGQVEDMSDAAWKLLATTRNDKFNEIEYHMPIDKGLETLEEIIASIETRKDTFFPIEARVTAPDDAWLSPFNDGRRFSIAIHAPYDEDFSYLFTDFEPILRKNGGRPHWGKMHSLKAKELRELYPKFDAFNNLRKELDPEGKFTNPYLAEIWGEA